MAMKLGASALAVVVAGLAILTAAKSAEAVPTAQRQAGATEGVWYWALPNTPGGTVPKQGWSGAGEGPNREIYVGGMDHAANAALYVLMPGGGGPLQPGTTLRYVGDARTAARAATNVRTGDRFEKFHTQPTLLGNRVYVANMDYSDLNAGHTAIRGLHWFAYDRATAKFQDRSAGEPGGIGAADLGLPGLVADQQRGLLYGLATPTGALLRYNPALRRTTNLGRPAWGRSFLYPGRALWVGSTGRVYFTAGNPATNPRAGGPYDPAVFNHVHFWDPAMQRFGEQATWQLRDTRAIDYARCFPTPAPRTCFLMDNVGHVYRFSESPSLPAWTEIGDLGQVRDELFGLTWVFQVRPDASKAYIVARRGAVHEMSLPDGAVTLLGNLSQLEPALGNQDYFGNSAWDTAGRFYFTAYPKDLSAPGRTRLVAIDPARFAASARAARTAAAGAP